jgi:hypothetical protein
MDWKYKHFFREQTFPSSLAEVREAARAYMSLSLGWRISEIADGFNASGVSFAHACIAHFHFQPATGGTHLRIELLVERASSMGFMLVDIGGYYNIQIGHWLDGIQDRLRQPDSTGQLATAGAPPTLPPPQAKRPAALLFNGCLLFIVIGFGLYFIAVFVTACVGLLTGHFVWIGRSGTSTLHGTTARITSGIILVLYAFLIRRIAKMSRR